MQARIAAGRTRGANAMIAHHSSVRYRDRSKIKLQNKVRINRGKCDNIRRGVLGLCCASADVAAITVTHPREIVYGPQRADVTGPKKKC